MAIDPLATILILIAFVIIFIFIAIPQIRAVTKLFKLRPHERVLHEEKGVRIKGQLGFGPAKVVITNERILAFCIGFPCCVVDFTPLQENLPCFHRRRMYATRNHIQVTTDESGNPCLEVVSEGPKLRTWFYYLRDLEAVRALFTGGDDSETGGDDSETGPAE